MAAKLLHSLADDNPDLQNQIGCMTGIFQLFDHQHVLNGRRISHKRLPSGNSHFYGTSLERDSSRENYRQASVDTNTNKGFNENQRPSTESSIASYSSSCSSSLSYMECNRAQPDGSLDRIIFPVNPARDPVMNISSVSSQSGRQSLDLRDVVKDSMHREARGMSVKTIKEEVVCGTMKHKDTPRPLQLSNSVNGFYGADIDGKANLPVDLKESLRVLAKLRSAPWYSNEGRERARSSCYVKDGQWHSLPEDAPRFSYDGRDISHLSFESRDTLKSTSKLEELPRLSLDSRGGSMQISSSDSKISELPKNSQTGGNSNDTISYVSKFSGAQKRPPGVVAKLMGLEALPDSSMAANNDAVSAEYASAGARDSFSRSHRTSDFNTWSGNSNPSKFSMKEPTSPRWKKNSNLVMRPVSSSRFPIEPAPWKQKDGSRGFQNASLRTKTLPPRTATSFPSVYSEIENRLKDIEFKQSGRDLRALKQILEAMQATGLLDTSKEEQGSNFGSDKTHEQCRSSHQNPKSVRPQMSKRNQSITSTVRGSDTTRALDSKIVIMKPAKHVNKPGISASSGIPVDDLSGPGKIQSGRYQDNKKASTDSWETRDQSSQNNHRDTAAGTNVRKTSTRNLRAKQFQSISSKISKGSNQVSVKNSESVSPRLPRKKIDLEKHSRPPTPPSNSTKPRRVSGKQATESASPGVKRRPNNRNMQHSDDQFSEISSDSRSLSCHEEDTSQLSDYNAFSDSILDEEITSNIQSSTINGNRSPSIETKCSDSDSLLKNSTQKMDEDGSVAELATVSPEQPSPVSVLDTSICRDDAPSCAKHISHAPADDANIEIKDTHDESHWNNEDKLLSNSVGSGMTLELNRKKLQNVENLVQKLRRLNSSHDEVRTDYIASLCENTHPDRRYISEILLASGLLLSDLGSELMTFQFHSTGHPVNPELFFVLERTKASTVLPKEECTCELFSNSKSDPGKQHRKLVFDTVNEILGVKLSSLAQCSETWLKPIKLARKTFTAQKLLKELCSEMENIQAMKSVCALGDEDDAMKSVLWEDVMHPLNSWTDFHNEMPGLVLDVERLVFKDLVDEIVTSAAPGLLFKPSRRRQLFAQ